MDYDDDPVGECPAVEVWYDRSPEEFFASSPKPRFLHPPTVKWRLGQVVRHKILGYRGVIIGWDIKAKVVYPFWLV